MFPVFFVFSVRHVSFSQFQRVANFLTSGLRVPYTPLFLRVRLLPFVSARYHFPHQSFFSYPSFPSVLLIFPNELPRPYAPTLHSFCPHPLSPFFHQIRSDGFASLPQKNETLSNLAGVTFTLYSLPSLSWTSLPSHP